MKGTTQPDNYPRFHRLTVGEVLDALKDCPKDAIIRFNEGGYLSARTYAAWGEVVTIEKTIHTCWE